MQSRTPLFAVPPAWRVAAVAAAATTRPRHLVPISRLRVPRRRGRRRHLLAVLFIALVALAGCGGEMESESPGSASGPPVEAVIGLTYIPDVQFAPFYLAEEAGYFAEAGVEVELRHHGASESLFGALEAGQEDLVVAGNDEILQAVAAGTEVRSVATMYQDYPVQIFVPEQSPYQEVADLAGHSIGVPGPFGQSWFGLLGYLDQAGLDTGDVHIEHVGFTLFNALSEGHVDAVTGFVTGDTAAFATGEFPVRTIADPASLPLVSVGLGASDPWLADHGEAVPAVIEALARAVDDIRADPTVAVEAAAVHIPGTMSPEDEAAALLTAEAMVELYGTGDFGQQDPAAWDEMALFMDQMGLLDRSVAADEAYTDEFTPAQ